MGLQHTIRCVNSNSAWNHVFDPIFCRQLSALVMLAVLLACKAVALQGPWTAAGRLQRPVAHNSLFSDDALTDKRSTSPLADEAAQLVEKRRNVGLEAKYVKGANVTSRIAELDAAIAELAWTCVERQQTSNLTDDAFVGVDDCAGVVLDAYLSQCGCSMRRAPVSLVAAAAASAALVGETDVARRRLATAVESAKTKRASPQRLGSATRSRLVAALSDAQHRRDAALSMALKLLDYHIVDGYGVLGQNAWLSPRARKSLLDAMVAYVRRSSKSRRLDDDETALLSYSTPPPVLMIPAEYKKIKRKPATKPASCRVDPEARRLADMLPCDEAAPRLVTGRDAYRLLDAAERLAVGAQRGRAKRDAFSRVAAIAYHTDEREEHLSMMEARDALRRAAGDDDGAGEQTLAAPVLRALLREAMGRGDVDAAQELLAELAEREALRARKRAQEGLVDPVVDDPSDNEETTFGTQKKKKIRFDKATLDVVLESCSEDGDAAGAAFVLGLRRRAAGALNDRATALAIQACVPDAAFGGEGADKAMGYAQAALEKSSGSLPVGLAWVTLGTARLLSSDDDDVAPQIWDELVAPLVESGAGSRALVAALEGCEAAAVARDAVQNMDDTMAAPPTRRVASEVAFELVSRFYGERRPVARVLDAAMRVFATQGATKLAGALARQRPEDENARYGALRCCSLAARPEAVTTLLAQYDDVEGPWSRLAIAIALARAGDVETAVEKYDQLVVEGAFDGDDARYPRGEIAAKARSAMVAALVRHATGILAAASLLQSFDGDDEDDDNRVCAALATRLGNARNWANALAEADTGAPKGPCRRVGESVYARLAGALVRSREARDVREAIVILTRCGIRLPRDVQDYIVEGAPRSRDLKRAMWGRTNADNEPLFTSEAERWYDSRVERRPPPLDGRRDRRAARRVAVQAATEDTASPPVDRVIDRLPATRKAARQTPPWYVDRFDDDYYAT